MAWERACRAGMGGGSGEGRGMSVKGSAFLHLKPLPARDMLHAMRLVSWTQMHEHICLVQMHGALGNSSGQVWHAKEWEGVVDSK